MTYENPWFFDGFVFDSEDIEKFEGFVYCIVNRKTEEKYIGRKYFYTIQKVKGKTRRQRKESNWKDYYGSSKKLLTDIEKYAKFNFSRHILSLHSTRGDCNRTEVELQWKLNILHEENGWYNDSIGNYRKIKADIINKRKCSKLFEDIYNVKTESQTKSFEQKIQEISKL